MSPCKRKEAKGVLLLFYLPILFTVSFDLASYLYATSLVKKANCKTKYC